MGLHDNIFDKKYKGAIDLTFWWNRSSDFHHFVNVPNSIDKLLQTGEERAFNFFESMFPMYIKYKQKTDLL